MAGCMHTRMHATASKHCMTGASTHAYHNQHIQHAGCQHRTPCHKQRALHGPCMCNQTRIVSVALQCAYSSAMQHVSLQRVTFTRWRYRGSHTGDTMDSIGGWEQSQGTGCWPTARDPPTPCGERRWRVKGVCAKSTDLPCTTLGGALQTPSVGR